MENWLVESDEILVGLTLAVLRTLLIDCKVYDRRHIAKDIEAVLEPNSHVVFSGFLLHPSHVVDSVRVLKVQSVVVLLKEVSMYNPLMPEPGVVTACYHRITPM